MNCKCDGPGFCDTFNRPMSERRWKKCQTSVKYRKQLKAQLRDEGHIFRRIKCVMTVGKRNNPTVYNSVSSAYLLGLRPTLIIENNVTLEASKLPENIPWIQNDNVLGSWKNWLNAARYALDNIQHEDKILILEDDIIFSQYAGMFLRNKEWYDPDCGCFSFYAPDLNQYRMMKPGIGPVHGESIGALALMFEPHVLDAILELAPEYPPQKHQDKFVGWACERFDKQFWSCNPSLVQHTGKEHSTLGHNTGRFRRAKNFSDANTTVENVRMSNKPNPKVDVVIPYYEGLKYLPESINSILWQAGVDVDIHLVNDCSPEEDQWVKDRYKEFENIHWYKAKTNGGPYKATNGVFRYLKHPFLAIQDADDIALPSRLRYSIDLLERESGDIISGVMEQFLSPEEGEHNESNLQYINSNMYLASGQSWRLVPDGCLVNGVTTMRRSCFINNNGFDGTLFCTADTEFAQRCHNHTEIKPIISKKVMGLRRLHNVSLSRGNGEYNQFTKIREKYVTAIATRIELWKTIGFDAEDWGTLKETPEDTVIKCM